MVNKSLKVLFLSNSLFVFASSLIGPLYAIYVSSIDDKILSVSFSWLVYLLSSVFFTYLIGRWGDKINEKEYLLLAGYIVRAVVWLLFVFADNLLTISILQFFVGFGEALGTPSFDTIFALHLDKNKQMFDFSVWKLIEKIAIAGATLVGGIIVTLTGFSYLFVIMSVLAICSFFIILLQPRRLL